jgi:catechol 2,3-dioxygenase-like lactoylglutathione lyase family enzyme
VISAVDHVNILVADLESATASYSRLLGREPSWQGEHPGYGTANTLYKLANTYLELISPAGDGEIAAALRARLESTGEGPLALVFGTADIDAAATTLRERGVDTPPPGEGLGRDTRTGATRRWRSTLLPVDRTRGVFVMLVQHLDAVSALPSAAPTGSLESVVDAVDHVVVMTTSAEETLGLYGGVLGLRLALDRTFEERKMRLLFFRVGGLTVECAVSTPAATPALGPPLEPGAGDRFWGISYKVPDIDAARARVAAAGFDVSDVRTGLKPGTRVCTVRSATHGVATLFLGPAATRA